MRVEIVEADSIHRFPKIKSIGGYFIRWFQKTKYSHYAIRITFNTAGRLYMHATLNGVHAVGDKGFDKNYRVTRVYSLPKGLVIDPIDWFEEYECKAYGKMQIIGLTIMILFGYPFNIFRNKKNRIICNELVLDYLRDGFILESDLNFDDLDLNDTREILEDLCTSKLLNLIQGI